MSFTNAFRSSALALLATLSVSGSVLSAGEGHPWYIGPKGGDIRKGHDSDPSANQQLEPAYVARTDKPWYIGPKGGDVRKGVPYESGTSGAVFIHPAVAQDQPSKVGPKGGPTRHGF